MKTWLLFILFACAAAVRAADLPTVTVEHLYYLQARADRVRRFKKDEMIEYCLALKLGGPAFESLYSQLFSMRTDLAKMIEVDGLKEESPRVIATKKLYAAYLKVLEEDAERVQNGLIREGQVATDALQNIARVQNGQ